MSLHRPQSEKDSSVETEGGGAGGTGSDVPVDAGDASQGSDGEAGKGGAAGASDDAGGGGAGSGGAGGAPGHGTDGGMDAAGGTAGGSAIDGSAPINDGAVPVDSAVSSDSGAGGAGNGAPDVGMDGAAGTGGSSGIDASSGIDGSVGSDGPPTGGTGFIPGPTGCLPMTLEANLDLTGYKVDRYGWSDSACTQRSAALVRNDATDPGGSSGGYLRELKWRAAGVERTARGTGANGWNGWGYVVNHYASTADHSKARIGTFRSVLSGAHHAIHEFKLRVSPGGPVDVTIHWMFATGRSHPIYAITFDATPAGPDVVKADSRAPYGDLAFEGTEGEIAGIGWGDKYRFTTTGTGPVTAASTWDYTAPNTVPYVRMWSQLVDAEMGAVQTQSFEQHVAGGDYGTGLLMESCWKATNATAGADCHTGGDTMPPDWLWPFQLNQYELPFTKNSHRLAWGSTYGAVGQTAVSAFGKTLSGYPRESYAVYSVLGPRTADATLVQATSVEHLLAAALTATEGTVIAQGLAGAGRNDTVLFSPPGYNQVYATWDVATASSRATVRLAPNAGAIEAPIFRFQGFTSAQPSQVTLNGALLTPGSGYFATFDAAEQTLWLTLNGTVTAPVVLHVE